MCLDNGEGDLAQLDRSFLNVDNDTICAGETITDYSSSSSNSVRKGDCKIPAFFVRRKGAQHTLLFSHGNAEDLGMMYKRMKDLALVLCVNIMAYDYTGYGLSTGSETGARQGPSENMIYRNIEAAYKYLREQRNIPASSIILYGRSLGSGPSCYLAAKTTKMGEPVGGLILHSPFLSVYKVVADVWGMDVRGDMFNNEKRAKFIRCPTLIIHGKLDEVVPFWHAPRLLNAIPPEFRAQPFYVDDLGHNHIESRYRGQYLQAITNFLMRDVPLTSEGDAAKKNRVMDAKLHRRSNSGFDPIPVNERVTTKEANEHNSSFYINQTWLRHAKLICAEVFSDNVCSSTLGTSVSSGSTRNNSLDRDGRRDNGGGRRSLSMDKYQCNGQDDARDENEFAPWMNGVENHHQKQTSTQHQYVKRQFQYQSDDHSVVSSVSTGSRPVSIVNRSRSTGQRQATSNNQMSYRQYSQKQQLMRRYGNKSSSMPLESRARSPSKKGGGFLGFRK